MTENSEVEELQQRLKEALTVSELLRNDLLLEREVNQELASRNMSHQKDFAESEERMKISRQIINGLEIKLKGLLDIPGSPHLFSTYILSSTRPTNLNFPTFTGSADEKETEAEKRHKTVQECIKVCQDLQETMLTRAELAAAEAEQQALAAAAVAAAIQAEREASEIVQQQAKLDAVSVAENATEPTTADVAAHVPFEVTEPANTLNTVDSNPTLSVACVEEETTLSEDEEFNRTRSESMAGVTRPRNYSIGGRRNSSIFIRLPDLAGTSLIRRSSDAMNTSYLPAGSITGSTEGDLGHPSEDHHQQSPLTSSHKSRTFSGDSRGENSSLAEEDMHSQDTSINYNNNDSMDMNVSRFPLNESVFYDPMEPTCSTQDVALFEHFIVVGASEQVCGT